MNSGDRVRAKEGAFPDHLYPVRGVVMRVWACGEDRLLEVHWFVDTALSPYIDPHMVEVTGNDHRQQVELDRGAGASEVESKGLL